MKKITLLIVTAFIIQATASSQSCLPEGIIFTTQVQIDDFQINHPNCTIIEGDVEIIGDDITNLNGLNVLTAIEGGLKIGENDSLTSLTGLDNITSVGGTLRIFMNPALTSLSGLDNVSSIGGNLRITGNDTLGSLTALNNLTSVGENLRIYMNAVLTSLSGLDNVTSVGDNLRITNNDALTSLTALNNLTSIGGELGVGDNDALTSLAGLDSIDAGSITELSIYNNISLSTCEVQSVCNYLASPQGAIDIHDNATGCNSKEEVVAVCTEGVPEISNSEFTIYPNPAKKEIFLLSKNGAIIKEVNIYNQTGQKVFHENQIANAIDVSMLPQGMYIIELVSDQWKVRRKLIIKF